MADKTKSIVREAAFLMAAQTVGMILLIGLMILAFGNDIFRLLK